jgi:hypothetical protein
VMDNYSLCKVNQDIVPADDPKRWPRDCDKIQVWKTCFKLPMRRQRLFAQSTGAAGLCFLV